MITDIREKEYVEISTGIGCPVYCQKYCPQEVITKNYTDPRKLLKYSDFVQILENIPPHISIIFSGFCEPFVNPDTIAMIEHAAAMDREIGIFTTLCGLKPEDISTLSRCNYILFCIHLPDGKIANIPITQEYKDMFFRIITSIPNVEFSIMNDNFRTLNRENTVRGIPTKKFFLHFCYKWGTPQPVVVPNGDVYLCGCDFGLWYKLGNLLDSPYDEIMKNYHPPYELCYSCNYMKSISQTMADKIALKLGIKS
jgi:MoaA/NifB/PqqE/SkfB family radical SAM enzyme